MYGPQVGPSGLPQGPPDLVPSGNGQWCGSQTTLSGAVCCGRTSLVPRQIFNNLKEREKCVKIEES